MGEAPLHSLFDLGASRVDQFSNVIEDRLGKVSRLFDVRVDARVVEFMACSFSRVGCRINLFHPELSCNKIWVLVESTRCVRIWWERRLGTLVALYLPLQLLLVQWACTFSGSRPPPFDLLYFRRNKLMCGHIDPLAGEANSFQFQQPSLQQRSFSNRERIHQDLSSGADHSLPGQSLWAAVHCPAHLACHVGRSQQRRDLAVG